MKRHRRSSRASSRDSDGRPRRRRFAIGLGPGVLLLTVCALAVPGAAADDEGHSGTNTATVARIVSLAPHLTELAFESGAGDRLVGVVAWSDFPEPARALPRIGDAFRFDAEAIVALGATDALAWAGGTPPATIAQLRSLGIDVLVIETQSLDDIATAIESIGERAGTTETAVAAARRYRQRLERARDREAGSPRLGVFYQVSQRPMFTLGGRHVINEVLALCGARNVFGDLDAEAAAVGFEAVLDADPDVILVGADADRAALRELWHSRTGLSAARCDRIHGVEADTLVRPTPRILDGAEALCDWLSSVRSSDIPGCGIGPG